MKLKPCYHHAGVTRPSLPESWETVESWAANTPPFYNLFTPETTTTGNNEIKGKKQPDSFWANFPKREQLKKPTTRVNIKNLEALVNKHKAKWIQEDKVKANTAIKSLKHGAPACQMAELPAMRQRNAPSSYKHADKMTAPLKDWVAAGVVAPMLQCPDSEQTV
jgi:hypothetical protein